MLNFPLTATAGVRETEREGARERVRVGDGGRERGKREIERESRSF